MAARTSALKSLLARLQHDSELQGHDSVAAGGGLNKLEARLMALFELEATSWNDESFQEPEELGTAEVFFHEKAMADAYELLSAKVRCILWTLEVEMLEQDSAPAIMAPFEAKQALDSVHKRDIGELKALARPPGSVVEVVSACGVLLDNWPGAGTWRDCQRLMCNVGNFMDRLASLKPQDVPENSQAVARTLASLPDFTCDVMKRRSLAASYLVVFVEQFLMWCQQLDTPEMHRWKRAKDQKADSEIKRDAIEVQLNARDIDDMKEVEKVRRMPTNSSRHSMMVALDVPRSLHIFKVRERNSFFSTLPPAVSLEICMLSGSIFKLEQSPHDQIGAAKQKLSEQQIYAPPPLCQKWSFDGRMLLDHDCIGDVFQLGKEVEMPKQIILTVSLETMWQRLPEIGSIPAGEWRAAVEALNWTANTNLEGAIGLFLSRYLDRDLTQYGPSARLARGLVELFRGQGSGWIVAKWNVFATDFSNYLVEARQGVPSLLSAAMNILSEIHQAGAGDVVPILEKALARGDYDVQLLAMKELSKIGDGQVISRLIRILFQERADTARSIAILRCLALLLPDSKAGQNLQLEIPQKVEDSDIASLVKFFKAENHDRVWMAALDLIIRLGAKDDPRVQQVLLQRVKHGFVPALSASGDILHRGNTTAVDAVKNLLCTTLDPKIISAGLKLLRQLTPEGSEEATQLIVAAWIDSRDIDVRRKALQMTSELPRDVVKGDEMLMSGLEKVAQADWPDLRQDARGILDSVMAA